MVDSMDVSYNQSFTDWADEHYPPVREDAENPALEQKLREVAVVGAGYGERIPTSVNFLLHVRKDLDRYKGYFLSGAKPERIGSGLFGAITLAGGAQYTNEYQFATTLRLFVDKEIVQLAEAKLMEYDCWPPSD